MNDSEKILSAFSEMHFYKELIHDNLHFTPEGSTEKEVADLLINAGDFIIAIQLKSRNKKDQTDDPEREFKWLSSKCRDAKKQVKESIEYIKSGKMPAFKNARSKSVFLQADAEIVPLIVFMNENIEADYPHVLYKHSEDGMDINCMSYADFQEMCKILLTPIEIKEYLIWRLRFYQDNKDVSFSIFMDDDAFTVTRPKHQEALAYQFVVEQYGMENKITTSMYAARFSDMLHKLPDRVVFESEEDSSYPLILWFAHFNREEIKAYVERIDKALAQARKGVRNIVGTMRNTEQRYVIVFVATQDGYALDMDFLVEEIQKKCNFDLLLQVFCYWENSDEWRMDFIFRDSANRYLS